MKFLTNGYASIVSIALVGVAIGLWTRQSNPSVQKQARTAPAPKSDEAVRATSFVARTVSSESTHSEPGSAPEFPNTSADGITENEPSGIQYTGANNESEMPSDPDSVPTIEMLPGIAHPLQVAEIAAAADGPLWKLFVSEGDSVTEDTVLALIDNRVAHASMIAAQSSADRQAMLKAANAKVSLAEQFLNRIQQAAAKKAASGLEVDEATSRLTEAKAALQEGLESQREAEARLQIEKARLDTYEVRAPFQGTVVKIYPHLGETVSRGAPLIKIADIQRLRADLYVPISLISKQRIGEIVELRADLPNQPLLKAKIVFIAPLIDAATKTTRIVVEIENVDNPLPAGFAVRLSQTRQNYETP